MRGRKRAFIAVFFVACTAALQPGVVRGANATYRVGLLSTQWQRAKMKGADLVYTHDQGGSILANALCKNRVEDVPLDVLTQHLLFEVEDVRELERQSKTLAGREALRSHWLGSLDGVAVEMMLVVLKKDNCTYDLQLIASPRDFERCVVDFDRFVEGFET